LWRFVLASVFATLRAARKFRPDRIVAGSGLTAPAAFIASRATGCRSVVYLHGLDLVAPNVVYQTIWLRFIRRIDIVLVNSRHTRGLALAAGLEASRIHVLNPGTDVPDISPDEGRLFRARHGLPEGPILLSVGRLTRRKGLAELVEQALPGILRSFPTATLAIVGGEASDALHGSVEGEGARIEASAAAANVSRSLRFLGTCSEDELSQAFAASACHVFPIRAIPGDVEGFGMVALEAAAHGVPTVAFDVGGVADAVGPATGVLVPPGDYAKFANAVCDQLSHPSGDEVIGARRRFAGSKDWQAFGDGLLRALSA
jgi:phosphatidylinositol alpha-1,6-mannosyltransferase